MTLTEINLREKEFHNKLQSKKSGRFETIFYKAIYNAKEDFLNFLRENSINSEILDFGCGSGILAIAAALLGATAVAVDHDDQAVLATTENALFNGVSTDQLQVFNLQHWNRQAGPSAEPFDVISANILAGPLQQLADHFCGLLKSGGRVVLSGILPQQVDGVIEAYPLIDFVNPVIEDDWACLIGTKHLNVR